MRSLVFFHARCRDGQASAWVASKALPDAELIGVQYGGEPDLECAKGRDVYVIDFSWKRDAMKRLILVSRKTVVLDHHKTAESELNGILEELQQIDQRQPGDKIVFDMERSGAGIAWDYWFPHSERPWVVNYVQDRDLWRWALDDSRLANAYIATLPYEPEALERVPSFETAITLGAGAQAAVNCYADAVCENAYDLTLTERGFSGHSIPSVTACQHSISEVLERLMEKRPEAPFVLGWWRRKDGTFQYSLRSRGDFDVSEVAKYLGGGGHKNAAGFQMPRLLM